MVGVPTPLPKSYNTSNWKFQSQSLSDINPTFAHNTKSNQPEEIPPYGGEDYTLYIRLAILVGRRGIDSRERRYFFDSKFTRRTKFLYNE